MRMAASAPAANYEFVFSSLRGGFEIQVLHTVWWGYPAAPAAAAPSL